MRLFKLLIGFFIVTAFFCCKKDSDVLDTTPRFYFVHGGSASFDNNLVLFPSSDTATINLVISSTFLLSKATTVTLAVDDSYRNSYNSTNNTAYQAMPSQAYNFQTTFNAGINSIYDTIPLKINKQYLTSGNFMLPIKITDVGGNYKIDSGSSVIYINTSNNKLAGIYSSAGTRISFAGEASNKDTSAVDSFSIVKTSVPLSENTAGIDSSNIDYADLGPNGWQYLLVNENGVFTVSPNVVITNSVQAGSFKVLASSYNPVTRDIYIKSSYKNLSGDERIVEESLTLQ